MRICINGGHFPGRDPGALGARTDEATLCRRLMEMTAVVLRECGCEVATVQADDLEVIVGVSDGFKSEVFVSIHCNAAVNMAAHGTEIYAMSSEGFLLADAIRERLLEVNDLEDRGTKDGSHLYVVNQTEAVAVLVETAFISNFDDETLLIAQTESFAAAIGAGVMDYLYGKDVRQNG